MPFGTVIPSVQSSAVVLSTRKSISVIALLPVLLPFYRRKLADLWYSNGRTPGITLPSAIGQEAVIRKAYRKAGLDLDSTAYVECHGTGTPVGDPIEVEAVSRVFNRPGADATLIGSVKTNLGHGEAASGISSIIKTTLALENGLIPATIGVKKVNPKIKTDEWNVEIVTKSRPWPTKKRSSYVYNESDNVRRAGVNSFGYGGANAHVILENADAHVPANYGRGGRAAAVAGTRTTYLLPLSATTKDSLDARLSDLAKVDFDRFSVVDLAYTLGLRRSQFSKRGYLVVRSGALKDQLVAENLRMLPNTPIGSPSRFAFVFTGQGAQWAGMGKELFDEFSVFRDSISEMDSVLQSLPHPPSWSLRDALREPEATSKINEVTHSQPTCTALQIGLIHLLASWGITPSAVLGHSSGEIAATYAAGHISAAEAITAAYYRGYVVGKNTLEGAMMAAGLSAIAATAEIEKAGLGKNIRVACINSPESVTISGDSTAIDTLLKILQGQKLFARKLKTGGRAYHSHHMWVLGEEYQQLLERAFRSLDPSSKLDTGAKFISSVTGEPRSADINAAYWRSNLENPVRFADAVTQLIKDGDFHCVELGPHSALELPVKQTRAQNNVSEESLPYSTALSRGKDAVETALGLAGRLFLHGNSIDMGKVNDLRASGKLGLQRHNYKVLHDLPAYQWTYDRVLWNECRASLEFRQRKYPRHELLGSQVPAGNGQERTWRNILRVDDIPWLRDHKLEETVVFPGAGYVAMAVEATHQACGFAVTDKVSIELQNVNILAALPVSTESAAQVELFTSLRPTPITGASNSARWYEFSISSFKEAISTTHATGSISMTDVIAPLSVKFDAPKGTLEPNATRTWYEKLIKEGLNFGKSFQSISAIHVPRMKSFRHCTTRVPLLQHMDEFANAPPTYVVHPITIDAMLQSAIIATTAGVTRDLRAKVPTRIGRAVIETPDRAHEKSWHINSQAEVVGFGAAEINAELVDEDQNVNARIENVRLAPYDAANQLEQGAERHPMLRVLWKPDIHGLGLIPEADFTKYLDDFVAESHSDIPDEGLLKLGATLNLLSHRNPGLRILELANEVPEITQAALGLLLADTPFKRLSTYTTGHFTEDHILLGASVDLASAKSKEPIPIEDQKFDLVLLPNVGAADAYLDLHLPMMRDLIAPDGVFLTLSTTPGKVASRAYVNGFEAVESKLNSGSGSLVLARPTQEDQAISVLQKHPIVLVDRGINVLGSAILERVGKVVGKSVQRMSLSDVTEETLPRGTMVISLLETETPLLAGISDEDMGHVKVITDNASTIIWITSGDLLSGRTPDVALVQGLSRALMLEQPSLRFFTYDVDDISRQTNRTADSIVSVLKRSVGNFLDYEFIERTGVAHVSRFVPDDDLNHAFRQKQGSETIDTPLKDAKPAQIAITTPGQFDTIYFKQIAQPEVIDAEKVQVGVTAVGLNAKDFYALGGKVDTKDASCTLEYCGVVERVGSNVSNLKTGDRVVVMAPSYFKTSEVVPQWACQKLRDDEDFNTLSTLSVVYATALYALHSRAQIQEGESVLIHSGAGGVGIAAIQIAQLAGAEIFTTVSTEAKKEYLVKTFGLKPSNVFSSKDASFLPDVLNATQGRGVDIVLNSLTGDLLHASWRCCANFGRFVEIGKRDLTDAGRLEMDQFLKNATFSAFDMSYLYNSDNPAHHRIWAKLMAEVLDLYRQKKIAKIEPLEVFDIADLTSALRYFSSRNRMGKVAINMENPESTLKVQPFKHTTAFSPDKSYIMIGCLGGLGRSMSKWMMARGARKFVFLGRSGIDKAPARRLVEDLQANGAECKVVRGDVCSADDVQKVVDQADSLIGGVIQAAMGLNVSILNHAGSNHTLTPH